VYDDDSLAEALAAGTGKTSRSNLAFDLDTYRLLLKHLAAPARAGLTLLTWPALL
jgi:hypothetical protein